MAKIVLGTHFDLDGNQLQNTILHPLSSHPTSVGEGQLYYNSTYKSPYINIGGNNWLDLSFNVLNSTTNKIDEQYLPESLLGKVEYVGGWNADTNTPDIGLASESKGKYYIVTTPGTFEGTEFKNKDWVISNGTTWEKVDNTESVIDIFGRQGSVIAQESDYESFYPKLNSTYDDPTWITGIDWSKLKNTPTTLSGYGITDAFDETTADGKYVLKTGDTMSGDLIPETDNVHSLGSPDKAWRDLYVGPGSLYVNGKKVIEDVSDTMNFTTSLDQNLAIKTSGVGGLQISTLGSGNIELVSPNGLIQFKGTTMFQAGELIRSSNGTSLLFDDSITFSPTEGVTSDLNVYGDTISNAFIVEGGTSLQFLKADGSVDENTYITGVNNITEIPNRSYNDLQDLPTEFPVEAHTHDQYLEYDDEIILNNSHINKKLYINVLDDVLFRADIRYNVTIEERSPEGEFTPIYYPASRYFDGNYDYSSPSSDRITAGYERKVLIDFNGNYSGYPYGDLVLSFYGSMTPENVVGRVYCNYEPHGIGWHDLTFISEENGECWRAYQGKYAIQQIELIVISKSNGGDTSLTNIELRPKRASGQEKPYVNKYNDEKFYTDLDFVHNGRPKVLGQEVYHPGNFTNITQLPNRDYADLTGKPTLNLSNWDTAYSWGDYRQFGLGITSNQGVSIPGGNCNTTTLANGLYKITPSTLNSPIGGESGSLIVERTGVDNYITQKAQMVNSGDVVKLFLRHYKPVSGTWTPWRRVWTTEDFTSNSVGNWNAAYGWGNHANAGYLTTENDPVFAASPAGTITESQKTNWTSAFNWGNHANAGYLTSLPTHDHDSVYVNKAGDTMTGDLLFNSNKLFIGNGYIKHYNDGDIGNLTGGSTAGTIFKSQYQGHMVLKLDANDVNDSFSLVRADINNDGVDRPATTLLFQIKSSGYTTLNGDIETNGFIKSGGTSSQFLKADGSVDSNTYITGITVTDDNTNTDKHQIATIEGTPLYETVIELLEPTLNGNTLNINFKGENGVTQSKAIDLSSLTTVDTSISNASWDASNNILTISRSDGEDWTINLNEFSNIMNTDANGITTLTQEGVVKLTVSKVGQTGEWGDILNKPTIYDQTQSDERYVSKGGDTMSGHLYVPQLTVKSDTDQKLVLQATDSGGTDGVSDGAWNYIGFKDSQGDRQGYFGINPNGDFVFNTEVIGARVELNSQLYTTENILADGYQIPSGTSSQFLKADGSVDDNNYLTGLSWSELTDKPETFTPEPHTHDYLPSSGGTITGNLNIDSGKFNGLDFDTNLISIDPNEFDAAHFNYVIKREDIAGLRTGTVMAVWESGKIEFTDTSTKDLRGTTEDLMFDVIMEDNQPTLRAIINGGVWTVKLSITTI